ncbi:BamA/TamA family outer membrane protein [Candidatus Babeliales bacterium]|nr:BamA/TamA family outer membrane protein [Candidatus Babeliales bacterium]MCF7899152.1 BamA/TamA family outer membrane protein [Candidatus Babeliales bacterium]
MFLKNKFLLIFLFNLLNLSFIFFVFSSQNNSNNEFDYKSVFAEINERLDLKETNDVFYLSKLTFSSDVPFSKEEFLYLTDLKERNFFKAKDIFRAYKNLMAKKRFSKIDIEISEISEGKIINFNLFGNWIFKKVELKNIWFDRDQYLNLYLQQPGDAFEISVHEESIKKIENYLHDNGFFNCEVDDELIYRKANKIITVGLSIKKNKCFIINKVDFQIHSNKNQKDIVQENIHKFKNSLIRKIGNRLLGKEFSKKLIDRQVNIIRKFFKKKSFLSCHISAKRLINKTTHKVNIIFNIKLGKRKILHFSGNTVFTEKQIKEDILGEDFPDWLFIPEIISQHLIFEYRKKGYWKASITYKQDKNGALFFEIKEGEPILIKDVILKNVQTNLSEQNNLFFNNLVNKKQFDEKLLEEAIENLKNHYLSNGFWDFEIKKKEFVKTQEKNLYSIILNINTGIQRFWGGFKIENFDFLEKENFFKKYCFEKKENSIHFNYSWLQEQKSFLIKYFQNQGYWYVDVYPELKTDANSLNTDSVHVHVYWKIKLGPKIKFGKILIRGNTKLPFKRILKELRFKEGESWDKKKLDLTRSSLKKLDIFKHVQLRQYKVSKNKNEKKQPVILNLIDDDPIQARLRLGYFLTSKNFLFKRESTYAAGGSIVFKNVTNNADKLQLNADFTRFERKINFDYQQPNPFGLSFDDFFLMGKLKAYSNKFIHPVQIGNSGSAFQALTNGFSMGLNSEYKNDHFLGLNLGNEWVNTQKVRGNLNFDSGMINKTLPYFFIEPTFVMDKLDDKINVKKGSLTFFALKFMVPEYVGEVTAKLMFEQSLFYPFFDNIIFGVRLRFGHIFRQQFDKIEPVERFFLGGPYSVRGYEKDAIPPLGVWYKTSPDGTIEELYTIQGGSSMINANLEIRFPIYKAFGGVLFQDFGVLSQTGFSGFKGSWYPASGFGFRYQTPIGSLRFDIGWKWKNRLTGDSSYAWYLTLGQAF